MESRPVFQVETRWRVGKSAQREAQAKGGETPVVPTQ
jgi:hypothetical protein